MKINGKTVAVKSGTLLLELLLEQGYDPTRIAVERNGEISPRSAYGQTVLQETDVLEIVRFVGGG